jgi:hypothetical protein
MLRGSKSPSATMLAFALSEVVSFRFKMKLNFIRRGGTLIDQHVARPGKGAAGWKAGVRVAFTQPSSNTALNQKNAARRSIP